MGNMQGYCGDTDRVLRNQGRFSRAEWNNSMKEVWGLCSQREQHMQRHRGAYTIISRWLEINRSTEGAGKLANTSQLIQPQTSHLFQCYDMK